TRRLAAGGGCENDEAQPRLPPPSAGGGWCRVTAGEGGRGAWRAAPLRAAAAQEHARFLDAAGRLGRLGVRGEETGQVHGRGAAARVRAAVKWRSAWAIKR